MIGSSPSRGRISAQSIMILAVVVVEILAVGASCKNMSRQRALLALAEYHNIVCT